MREIDGQNANRLFHHVSFEARVRMPFTNHLGPSLMTNETNPSVQPWLNAIGSRYFLDWLLQQRCSLAFTTYQTGKLFLVGRKSASGGEYRPASRTKRCRSSSGLTTTAWECVRPRMGGQFG